MKNKYWGILLFIILAVCAVVSIPLFTASAPSHWAEIHTDGELNRTVNLKIDQEFTVPCSGGYNTVTVKEGKVAVTEASCPDGYCMDRGFCDSGTPIVCLPNKLVIKFVGQQEIDGEIG